MTQWRYGADRREWSGNARLPRQNQRTRMEGLSNAADLRQARPGESLVFTGRAADLNASVQPGEQAQPVDTAPNEEGAAIFSSMSPWMLSIGRKPYPARVERCFTHIIQNPQTQISVGQDFILTEIIVKVIPNTHPAVNPQLINNWELNIRFNRKYLFSDNVPLQFFPEAPFSLQLPCPYFLPKGTEIVIDGLIDAAFRNAVWFGFYGYFVIETPPRDVMHLLARPVFYVKRFDRDPQLPNFAVQLGACPVEREVKMFELNRLICIALERSAGDMFPILPTCDQNLQIADIFTFQNMLANWRMLWGTNYRFPDISDIPSWANPAVPNAATEYAIVQMPRYISPPVKTCAGSSMLINYSDPVATVYGRHTYFIIGGKHVYD